MAPVAVLLSTLNGARFISEQIASIQAQTHQNHRLFWRDDGSTDETIAVMQARFGITPSDAAPLGITGSYARLLLLAYDDGCSLFAFADQDDVWIPSKLARGVRALQALAGPALYCARQTLVDDQLRRLGASPAFHEPIGFPAALTQNIAAGCTIMFNRPAAELLIKTFHRQPYHDWWCYLLIAAAGGRIITDDTEVIHYRQHASNTIGASSSPVRRALAAMWRGPRSFMDIFRSHVASLASHDDLLSPAACHDLMIITTALAQGPTAKWRALQLPGFHRQTRKEDLLFRLWFLIG
jgi:glycosyltransferase involved in cell wall biosynthesis